ncbi:hypothetical protein BDV96DRAFT_107796 [Lophiotrema nucula]|uniref:Uncharacterized protein n=1 Tax=Lophiotrema nucula TaxID=690887 RepID=A0A6A5Z4W7_9PLEO|nr:hypothetical protein BDV96DRAFT_107796 [Lophiotrema nucula]
MPWTRNTNATVVHLSCLSTRASVFSPINPTQANRTAICLFYELPSVFSRLARNQQPRMFRFKTVLRCRLPCGTGMFRTQPRVRTVLNDGVGVIFLPQPVTQEPWSQGSEGLLIGLVQPFYRTSESVGFWLSAGCAVVAALESMAPPPAPLDCDPQPESVNALWAGHSRPPFVCRPQAAMDLIG